MNNVMRNLMQELPRVQHVHGLCLLVGHVPYEPLKAQFDFFGSDGNFWEGGWE